MRRIILNIGELAVSKEEVLLETILGSCVAVCLWDERQRIGGLNHFLLPHEPLGVEKSTVYGETSIDTLVEQIHDLGADMTGLRAQIFGGGSLSSPLEDIFEIGSENVKIARERMRHYGIPVVGGHMGDNNGIRVSLRISTGEVTVCPLGTGTKKLAHFEATEMARLSKPCNTCIRCGSCDELGIKRRKGRTP